MSCERKCARRSALSIESTKYPPSGDPGSFKGLLVRMNVEAWRTPRILAAEGDITLNALAIKPFNDLLKKHAKRATVENPLVDDPSRLHVR